MATEALLHNGGEILDGEMKYEERGSGAAQQSAISHALPLIWYLMHIEQCGYERKCVKSVSRGFDRHQDCGDHSGTRTAAAFLWKFFRFPCVSPTTELW